MLLHLGDENTKSKKKLLKIFLRNNSTFNQNNFNITNPIKYKHKTTKACLH